MEKALTFDHAVGNAVNNAEKQNQGVNILGIQLGVTGQSATKLITPELMHD